ncbi:carboxylesterase/lipase family protein [Phenylobacterium montanum]|uniref:Carboxylic ester hydrolase n=1 Tax=Phenylobacterium montanum TaxID=2823693 RepID=A0A975G4G5_9CAUL|nr:carboxylesterase family protein [Caulobacter sp. S6]QUD90619.1 carboxylesterase/lipase family protein [Caulobacter sp. S6]
MSFVNPDRRTLFLGLGGALAAPALARAQADSPVATTARGRLRGLRERGVCVFRGIPYAGPVSGRDRRFKAPPPAPSWTGVRDATHLGAPAIQPVGGPGAEPPPSEDCLFLNIWTPAADGAQRPVMFYSHGGGFTVGSGGRAYQDGANLAREQDVVVVASNHRLGLFGYLYLGHLLGPEYEGNQGLQDLVAALAWVKENISAFGGDPDNVMIFGESGGGGKTACLYAMPGAAPYFNKASIESPIGPEDRTPEEATDSARRLMKALGLTDPRQLLDAPAAALLGYQTGGDAQLTPGAQNRSRPQADDSRAFWPFIDGRILPEVPFKTGAPLVSADKPLIIGGCRDEAVFFFLFGDKSVFRLDDAGLHERLKRVLGPGSDDWTAAFRRTRPTATPSQLFMAILTATPWRAHAVRIAETKAAQARASVYSYILNYASPARVPGTDFAMGSPHASDIAMKFDNVDAAAPGGGFGADSSEARRRCARNMSTLWGSFAHTGRPAAPGQPAWPAYTLPGRETLLIDAECRVESDPEGEERRFWQARPDAEQIRY